MITLYSNGFILGNGEFRDTKDPKNQKTLDELKKGEVPEELEKSFPKEWGKGDAVRVQLVDKSTEAYTVSEEMSAQERIILLALHCADSLLRISSPLFLTASKAKIQFR